MKNPRSCSNLPVILSENLKNLKNLVLLWFVSYKVHWVLTREFWILTFDKLLRLSRWEKDVFATKRLNDELLKILNWEITGLNNDSLDDMWWDWWKNLLFWHVNYRSIRRSIFPGQILMFMKERPFCRAELGGHGHEIYWDFGHR